MQQPLKATNRWYVASSLPVLTSWRRAHANMRPLGDRALSLSGWIFACNSTDSAVPRACALHASGTVNGDSLKVCDFSDNVIVMTANHGGHMAISPASRHSKLLKGPAAAGAKGLIVKRPNHHTTATCWGSACSCSVGWLGGGKTMAQPPAFTIPWLHV